MTLLQFNDHRRNKLTPEKQAHIATVEMVNIIGNHYNTATLPERITSALSFIAMGICLLKWAVIAQWVPYQHIEPALYDSEPTKTLQHAG